MRKHDDLSITLNGTKKEIEMFGVWLRQHYPYPIVNVSAHYANKKDGDRKDTFRVYVKVGTRVAK